MPTFLKKMLALGTELKSSGLQSKHVILWAVFLDPGSLALMKR